MRYIKTLGFTILPFVLGAVLSYLVGSFVCATFDSTAWEMQYRLAVVAGSLLAGIALYARLVWEGLA